MSRRHLTWQSTIGLNYSPSLKEVLWDVVEGIKGLLLGDKGYLSASLQNDLSFYQIELQTPKHSNMIDERPKHWDRTILI